MQLTVTLQQPAAQPYLLSCEVFQGRGWESPFGWEPPTDRGHLTSRPSGGVPARLLVSQLDWQVQSNHSVLWGPKLTPVTQLSQHNAHAVSPAWPGSLCHYWITAQVGTVHSGSNWKHVIKKKKKKKRTTEHRSVLHRSSLWKLISAWDILIMRTQTAPL